MIVFRDPEITDPRDSVGVVVRAGGQSIEWIFFYAGHRWFSWSIDRWYCALGGQTTKDEFVCATVWFAVLIYRSEPNGAELDSMKKSARHKFAEFKRKYATRV